MKVGSYIYTIGVLLVVTLVGCHASLWLSKIVIFYFYLNV